MAGKIYVLQRALFHADTPAELDALSEAATRVIRDGGGAIEAIEEPQRVPSGADAGSYVRYVDYWLLKTSFDDLAKIAEQLAGQRAANEVALAR